MQRAHRDTDPGKELFEHLESIFEAFPDGVIACDYQTKIVYLNAAAHVLFEKPDEAVWKGVSFQRFLKRYEMEKMQQGAPTSLNWPLSWIMDEKAFPLAAEKHFLFRLPSGRQIAVRMVRSRLSTVQKHPIGMLLVFQEITPFYEKATYLQRVWEATSALIDALAHVPAYLDMALPEETPFLSPAVLFIAQQLVDVIRQILKYQQVSLLAFGSTTESLYYVAGSGFTSEQERSRRELRGRFGLSDFLDEKAKSRLQADQELLISTSRLRFCIDYGPSNLLVIPFFLEQQLAGILIMKKASETGDYPSEEVTLVKAVVAQAILLIDSLHCFQEHSEKRNAALVMQEIHRLSSEFLSLAAHELRTPLTTIKGNIQVVQRRLERFSNVASEQPERVAAYLEKIRQPLRFATESVRVQQRMINAIIDDARLQVGTFQLSRRDVNLLVLLREVVSEQQQAVPTHPIILDIPPDSQELSLIADKERIKQVLTTYLENAVASSPAHQSVTVQLRVRRTLASISVHNEGIGLSDEEQKRLWDRFYRGKGHVAQEELNLSLGLGFSLCKAFVEHHQGRVGVRSTPGHGATFWFTLPLAPRKE
ncbi:MAG TPA: ATP-binding protein [Ktedonobacteraceae bacterium]|nr:ATP-binding protein [Ktedonobacteraceae bacterium]